MFSALTISSLLPSVAVILKDVPGMAQLVIVIAFAFSSNQQKQFIQRQYIHSFYLRARCSLASQSCKCSLASNKIDRTDRTPRRRPAIMISYRRHPVDLNERRCSA